MMTMFEMPYGYSESTDQLCRDTSKELFDLNANCKDPDQPAEIYRLIRNFSYLIIFYSTRWFYKRTVKVQIRLRGCAVWSGPTLSAYVRTRVFAWRPSAKSLELVTTRADYRVMHIQRIARHVKKYWPLIRGFWHARLRTYSWAWAQHFLQDCMCTSVDSDLPAHSHSLVNEPSWGTLWVTKNSKRLQVDSEDWSACAHTHKQRKKLAKWLTMQTLITRHGSGIEI